MVVFNCRGYFHCAESASSNQSGNRTAASQHMALGKAQDAALASPAAPMCWQWATPEVCLRRCRIRSPPHTAVILAAALFVCVGTNTPQHSCSFWVAIIRCVLQQWCHAAMHTTMLAFSSCGARSMLDSVLQTLLAFRRTRQRCPFQSLLLQAGRASGTRSWSLLHNQGVYRQLMSCSSSIVHTAPASMCRTKGAVKVEGLK